jgi:ethanolamine permease
MLKKAALGWPQVAGLGVSLVIAGQFSGWNYGLASNGWVNMLIATLLMAALCGGLSLCVAELSTVRPDAGGGFAYAQQAFGPFVGYLVGSACALALIIGTGVAATFVCAYTQSVFGVGGWPVKLALFAAVIGIHIRGVGEALGLTLLAAIGAAAALLAFGFAMWPHVQLERLLPTSSSLADSVSLAGVFGCIPFAIWLFITLEQVGTAAEEAADPGRSMPRGVIAALATLLLTAMTVLVCAPGAGGLEAVGNADDPLYAAITATHAFGADSLLNWVVGGGAVFGLIATFFSLVYSSSRQLYAMARDGHFFAPLARTGKRGTPIAALLTIAAIGLPVSMLPAQKVLLAIVLLLSLCYVIIFAAYLRIRLSNPNATRPFSVPCGPLVACIGMALTLVVIAACFQLDTWMLLALAATLAVLMLNYRLRRRSSATTSLTQVPDHV